MRPVGTKCNTLTLFRPKCTHVRSKITIFKKNLIAFLTSFKIPWYVYFLSVKFMLSPHPKFCEAAVTSPDMSKSQASKQSLNKFKGLVSM